MVAGRPGGRCRCAPVCRSGDTDEWSRGEKPFICLDEFWLCCAQVELKCVKSGQYEMNKKSTVKSHRRWAESQYNSLQILFFLNMTDLYSFKQKEKG
jgi:hypothetical protein